MSKEKREKRRRKVRLLRKKLYEGELSLEEWFAQLIKFD
jgi:hypothetical protein